MIITWRRTDPHLLAGDRSIPCSCHVRNEVNGERDGDDVVYTIPDKLPYMPRRFPLGRWNIGTPQPRVGKYLAPYFIPTDARQVLPVWELEDGAYFRPSGKTATDIGYGLHFSESASTLGCIKISRRDDLLWLVDMLNAAASRGEKNTLLVFE